MKQQSRLHHLMIAINRWRESPRCSQRVIASEIVSAVNETGLSALLEEEGITFRSSDDIYNDDRVNSQKIFRWFGQFEDSKIQLDTLFLVEQAIVAAMPEEIRLNYLNSIYSMADVVICLKPQATVAIDVMMIAASSLIKENAEAQVAVIEAASNPDKVRVQKAHKELTESLAVGANVLGNLEQEHPKWTGRKPVSALKAI